ncbi:Integrase zinc binding domain [Popillia japonica]|uniref:RNA-directed DNA polymerase n=1 Tax=Popillia japonica TaxID=7064 RepID=A0AAW1LD65_POPJA
MHIADLLSRSYCIEDNTDDDWITEVVHSLSLSLNITDEKRTQFKKATSDDPILSKVKEYHIHGWPKDKRNVGDSSKFYFRFQDQITLEDDLLFLNYKLIVPSSLRPYILKLLHEPHLGITKTKERARQTLYWPGLNRDIENLIGMCPVCEKFSNSNTKEPLITHDIADIPFNKIASDILSFEQKDYLVIQDYYSKWLELLPLQNKTATELIEKPDYNDIHLTDNKNLNVCDKESGHSAVDTSTTRSGRPVRLPKHLVNDYIVC